METLVDIFKSDLFTTTSLTAAINKQPTAPSVIGDLNLFDEQGVETASVVIEQLEGRLDIIPTAPRGAPGKPFNDGKRKGFAFEIPHLPAVDRLTPDQLIGVRQFGSASQLVSVQSKRDEKLTNMSNSLDYTLEYHRLGAIQGVVLDADGSPLFDLYDRFGVDEPDAVDFNLDATYEPGGRGAIADKIFDVKQTIRQALKNKRPRGLIALCGDAFFPEIANHGEVRSTYLAQQDAQALRDGDVEDQFNYRGCTFIHYPGWGDVQIADNECRFIPLGVPGLFITRFAPAPYFSAVATTGLPKYTLASLDPSGEKYIELEAQSNPLNICTQPEVLIKGTLT